MPIPVSNCSRYLQYLLNRQTKWATIWSHHEVWFTLNLQKKQGFCLCSYYIFRRRTPFSCCLTTLSSFRINPFLEFIFFHIFVESEFLTKEGMEGAFRWNIPLLPSQARWHNRWVQRDGLKLRFRGRTAVTWGNCWLFLKRPLPKRKRWSPKHPFLRGELVVSWEGIFFLRCFFIPNTFFSGSFMGQESTSWCKEKSVVILIFR